MGDKKPKLLSEVSSYPSYMRFEPDEMEQLYGMFKDFLGSMWQSVKLLGSTLALNIKVLAGTIERDRKKIKESFKKFQERRDDYDKEMAKNLQYFKKYYVDAGPGPKLLAFIANPLVWVAAKVPTAVVKRGEGKFKPFDINKPIKSTFGIKSDEKESEKEKKERERKEREEEEGTDGTKTGKISPRLARALDFFKYDASLNEAVEPQPQIPSEAQTEMRNLQSIGQRYVDTERQHADQLLKDISGVTSAIKKLTDSKDFNELITALRAAEQAGLKVSVNEIATASKNIMSSLEKQKKDNPDELAKTVELMRKQSPDINDKDPIEAASKFVFGLSKSRIQKQLIGIQDEMLGSARQAMNLPIDQQTRSTLQQSDIGKEYLQIVDNFERALETGERSAQQLKSGLKT